MMNAFDSAAPPFNVRVASAGDSAALRDLLASAMQAARLLETPAPVAALRWVETFIEAYGSQFETVGEALPLVAALRDEAVMVPALQLERLRNRQVLFFLDSVSQHVDAQPELRGLPVEHDVREIGSEFGLSAADAAWSVRMALTGRDDGPPLDLLFPLLGHDRIMMRIGAVNSHLLHGRGLEPIKYGPDGKPFRPIEGTPPERASE